MHTRLLMTLTAAVMAAVGLAASFLLQVTGALYLGFAMLNWMARANTIGGIYSRPIAIGNFVHFAVVAITLLKALGARHERRRFW